MLISVNFEGVERALDGMELYYIPRSYITELQHLEVDVSDIFMDIGGI